MWAYPRPRCLDHLGPEELSATEVETRMHKVLDSSIILSPDSGLDHLRRGITSVWASTLGPIYATFMILSIYPTRDTA
jgi:hypothetical protein